MPAIRLLATLLFNVWRDGRIYPTVGIFLIYDLVFTICDRKVTKNKSYMQIFIEEFLQKRAKSEKLHGNGKIADLVLKLAVMDVEHFARAQRSDVVTQLAYRTNDVRQVLTVGIGQEDLTETITAHKAHNARDTLRI